MRIATMRAFLAVHTWVGLAAGLALFIAFYAGAITVFTHDLGAWERSAARGQPPEGLAAADALIAAVMKQHPAVADGFSLHIPDAHRPELVLDWYEEKKAGGYQVHHFRLAPDGGATDERPKSELASLIYRLHYTAGLPASWGIYVLGAVCILYGLALVSGVVIYAPMLLHDLFALRTGKNLKRLWQDAHNVVGMLSLPFHVIFAWSGAVLTIGTLLLMPFQFLVFDGKLLKLVQPDLYLSAPVKTAGVSAVPLPARELLAHAQAAVPGMEIGLLRYIQAGDANGQVEVYGDVDRRMLNRGAAVLLKASSGEVLRVMEPARISPGARFLRGLYTLHFGDYGHRAVQWLYFILGMAGAFLFYSGNLLWIEARRKRRQLDQPRKTRLMAQLTLGVSLGCIAGISAIFVANKLLPASLAERTLWEERCYYAVFLLCLLWAFVRAPARGGVELLLLCALLTAAIPLANVWVTGDHLLRSLSQGQLAVFAVDALALLFAWVYWRMARALQRRARDGDPNSVWALPGRFV